MSEIRIGYKCRYCDEMKSNLNDCIEHERECLHKATAYIESYKELLRKEMENSQHLGITNIDMKDEFSMSRIPTTNVKKHYTELQNAPSYAFNGVGKPFMIKQLSWEGTSVRKGIISHNPFPLQKTELKFTFEIKEYCGILYLADYERLADNHLTAIKDIDEGKSLAQSRFESYCRSIISAILNH